MRAAALTSDVVQQVCERLYSDARLAAVMESSDEEWRQLLGHSIAHALKERLAGRSVDNLSDRQRDELLDALVRRAVDEAQAHVTSTQMAFALDRLSFDRLQSMSTLCHLAQVRAAVDRADYAGAAIRVLVRAQLEISTPAELLADILVGVDSDAIGPFMAIARMVDSELLLARLQRGRFEGPYYQMDRAIYAAFVVWLRQPEGDTRTRLITVLRRLARYRGLAPRGVALLGWLTEKINDAHLRGIYRQHHGSPESALATTLGEVLTGRWQDDICELLPTRADDPLIDALPVRAAPKVGRNDRCPCGSGHKYKKCCADRSAEDRDPRAQRSHLEALREIAPRLDSQQLMNLERADVARLEPQWLRDDALQAALHYLTLVQDWPRARRVLAEIAKRRGEAATDSPRRQVIHQAIRYQEYDVAADLFQELDNWGSMDLMCELTLHSARNDKGLVDLERWARRALLGPHLQPSDLARAALHTLPALGILLARGAYPHPGDHKGLSIAGLLAEVEEARDGLHLPPIDPAREMYHALGGTEDEDEEDDAQDPGRAELTKAAGELRAKLDEATARSTELARQVAELQAREPAAPAKLTTVATPAAAAAEIERVRQKQQRIDQLEAMIRSGNTERAELRHQLEQLAGRSASAPSGSPPRPEAQDTEAALVELPVVAGRRPVLVPMFGASAKTALEDVPHDVAAAAVVMSGRLAAGDGAAWRGVKQGKDMPHQVLMARVGIHHRLLFRADEDQLEVLDLVTRESLTTTLKRLRAS